MPKIKIPEKLKQMNIVANYRKIYPYVKPYLFRAILAILVTLPLGAMDAVIAWVLKPYMDVVMIEKSAKATSLLPLLVVVFSLAQSLLNYSATYLNTWVGQKITMDLKKDLFKKLLHLDARFFDRNTNLPFYVKCVIIICVQQVTNGKGMTSVKKRFRDTKESYIRMAYG